MPKVVADATAIDAAVGAGLAPHQMRLVGKASALVPASRFAASFLASQVSATSFQGSPLQTRTGLLSKSVASDVIVEGGKIIARIGILKGPAIKYGSILEEGGTIRPKKGRALAVPLSAAKQGRGTPRFPGGPRSADFRQKYPDAFLLKRKGKPPLIVSPRRVRGQRNGRVVELIPLFILLRSVKVAPRFWLSGGVRKNFGVWEVHFEQELG